MKTRRTTPRTRPARKRFGQHFLEPAWIDKLVRAIDPKPEDTFIEIGSGRGALTRPLADRARHVIAFEIDRDLARDLRHSAPPNVTVVEGDFLTTSRQLLSSPQSPVPNPRATLRVAANLPYNVASPILFKLVELYDAGLPIADATIMLQREVADRLLANPGTKEYGVLTVLMRHSATVERVMNLPAGAFRPVPKVQSTVVRLRFHEPDPPVRDRDLFARLVQAVFTRRRKTLANALDAFEPVRGPRPIGLERRVPLDAAGMDARRRPETLSIAEFARLADVFAE